MQRVKFLAKEHYTVPWPGIKPEPLDACTSLASNYFSQVQKYKLASKLVIVINNLIKYHKLFKDDMALFFIFITI